MKRHLIATTLSLFTTTVVLTSFLVRSSVAQTTTVTGGDARIATGSTIPRATNWHVPLVTQWLTAVPSTIKGLNKKQIDADYVDTWSYSTPQLYLFSGSEYARYDILTNQYQGKARIVDGYPGVPFSRIDAAYVDTWSYSTPQLYLFSGSVYARYDILKNQYQGIARIVDGYPGVPFSRIDAAYVDTWSYSTPQLYLFNGSEYARYDILKNQYQGKARIVGGYPGVPFSRIDAAYVDTWSYSTPQLYLFSGSEYARYDILKNQYQGKARIVDGYPGIFN